MLHSIRTALAACAIASAAPAMALQTMVTQIDKNADGSMTYHFSIRTDPGETLEPGEARTATGASTVGDFVTIYNFYGLMDDSVKSPDGWVFSSEDFGRTPMLDGYPMVLPVDVPNTPNLTWAVTKPVAAGVTVGGFLAATKMGGTVRGEYSAQVTRQSPALAGANGTPAVEAQTAKQALLGLLPTPSFLIEVK